MTSGKIDEQNRGEELLTIIIKYQDLVGIIIIIIINRFLIPHSVCIDIIIIIILFQYI